MAREIALADKDLFVRSPDQEFSSAVLHEWSLDTAPKSWSAASDEELMVAYQGEDESAFEAIYDRYHRRLYNFLLRLTANPEKAQDLFQMTFLVFHRNRKRYRPTGRFSSWFFTLAVNVARDEFRRVKRKREVSLDAQGVYGLDQHLACSPDQHARVEQREVAEDVKKAIMVLPDGQRVVILLSRYADMSYPEIAEVLKIKPNAVKQRAHEALRSLGRALRERS